MAKLLDKNVLKSAQIGLVVAIVALPAQFMLRLCIALEIAVRFRATATCVLGVFALQVEL